MGVVDSLYPSASQDATEPNDYPGLAVPVTVGTPLQGRIFAQNDTDIYAVSLNGTQTINVTLSGLTYDARLAVYSVGPYSTLKEEAFSENAGTANETLTFKAGSTGTYYIEVMPENNAGNKTAPYTLSVIKG